MAFNLKKIAMESETAFIHLADSSNEKLMDGDKKVGVNVYSPATTQHRNATRRLAKFAGKPESDEKDDAKIDYLCAITHSWENIDFEGLSGADLSRKIYSDATLQSIHQQIERECVIFGNFLPKSTSN